MEAQELRLGNWIEVICNDIVVPDSIEECNRYHLKDLVKGSDYYSYKPIPLTEEWLLKFGFHRSQFMFYDGSFAYYKGDFGIDLTGQPTWGDPQIGILHIKHVHQLQNLYFALVGKELTIKQTV